jgi:hypothetical protein
MVYRLVRSIDQSSQEVRNIAKKEEDGVLLKHKRISEFRWALPVADLDDAPRDQLPQKATCTNNVQPNSVQLPNEQGKINPLLGKIGHKVQGMSAFESGPQWVGKRSGRAGKYRQCPSRLTVIEQHPPPNRPPIRQPPRMNPMSPR